MGGGGQGQSSAGCHQKAQACWFGRRGQAADGGGKRAGEAGSLVSRCCPARGLASSPATRFHLARQKGDAAFGATPCCWTTGLEPVSGCPAAMIAPPCCCSLPVPPSLDLACCVQGRRPVSLFSIWLCDGLNPSDIGWTSLEAPMRPRPTWRRVSLGPAACKSHGARPRVLHGQAG